MNPTSTVLLCLVGTNIGWNFIHPQWDEITLTKFNGKPKVQDCKTVINDRPAQEQDRVVDSIPLSESKIETPATSAEFNNAVYATRPTDAPSAGSLSAVLPSSSGDVLSPRGKDLDCAITAGNKAPVAPQAQERVINLRVATTVGNDTQFKIEGSQAPAPNVASERPAGEPAEGRQRERHVAESAKEVPVIDQKSMMPESQKADAAANEEQKHDREEAAKAQEAELKEHKAEEQETEEQRTDEQQLKDKQADSQEPKPPTQNPHVMENLFAMLFQSRRGA